MGFRIEMDDFGTGYSSLAMLTNLPIDVLKLDMSFVRSAFGETRDVRMIELIIDIADYLHVPVIAEGVETEEQYLVLKAMGCDLVQGYYFSKPVPPEAFDRFIIERSEAKDQVATSTKKTYMSISKALTSDFESIFYIDVVTDFYLEFYTGKGGDLEIRPGGVDFFNDAREKLLQDVSEADAQKMREATSKTNGGGGGGGKKKGGGGKKKKQNNRKKKKKKKKKKNWYKLPDRKKASPCHLTRLKMELPPHTRFRP